MKKKALIVLLVLSLGFNAGVVVTIGYHWISHRVCGGAKPPDGARHQKHMQKLLRLTDAQAQAMHADWEDLQKKLEPVKQELEAKRAVLFTLIDSGSADAAAIDRAIGEVVPLQMKLEKTIMEHSLAFSKTLTPEQRQRFKAVFQKGAKRMPRGPGSMPGKMGL